MLGDFEHEAVAEVGGFERVQDFRKMAVKMHVDDGTDDLADPAGGDAFWNTELSAFAAGFSAVVLVAALAMVFNLLAKSKDSQRHGHIATFALE